MPATPSIASRIVTGTIVLPDGTPAQGSVRFIPSAEVRDITGHVTVLRSPLTVDLDADGKFAIELSVTDDPDSQPIGWVWEMTTFAENKSVRAFQLLSTTPPVVDVAEIEDASAVDLTPTYQYASAQSVQDALNELAEIRAMAAVLESGVLIHPFLFVG